MGFGADVLFLLLLGLLVLGPRQLHAMLGQVARAKAQIENAIRGLKSQLSAELHASPRKSNTDRSHDQLGI
jgi:Sec-independent protein translocase protein TatA